MAVHEPVVVITCRTPEYIQLKENTMLATMCSGMLENRTLEDHGGQCCLTAMGPAATLAVLARSYYICGGEAETGIVCVRQADPECVRSAFLAILKKTELGKEVGGGEGIQCH